MRDGYDDVVNGGGGEENEAAGWGRVEGLVQRAEGYPQLYLNKTIQVHSQTHSLTQNMGRFLMSDSPQP